MGEFDGLRRVGDPPRTGKWRVREQPVEKSGEFKGLRRVEKANPAKLNVNVAKELDRNPEAVAKAHKQAKESGYSIDVTIENPQVFENDFDDWEKSSVETKNYLSKSVNNVAVSRGDWDNLSSLDRVIKGVPQAYQTGKLRNDIADLRWRQLMGEDTPELTQQIDSLKAQVLPELGGQSFIERGLLGVGEQANLLMRTFGAGAAGGIVGASAGAGAALLLGQVPPLTVTPEEPLTVSAGAIKGYMVGSRVGAAREIFKLEASFAYDEFLDIRDVNGQPIDREIIKAASLAVGMVNAGLELVGFGAILKTLPGGDKILGRITSAEIKKLLTKETVVKSLREISKRFAKGVTTETITEVAQEAVNIFAAEISKEVSIKRQGTYWRPFAKKEAVERLVEVGKRTIETTTILTGAPTIANITNTIVRGEQSQQWIDKQTQVNSSVNNTLTKQRSADHIEAILDEHGQKVDVSITNDGIITYFQTDPEKAKDILTKIDVDADRALKDAELGIDTTVTLSKIQAQLTPEEFALIKGDLKENEFAYSENQLKNGVVEQEMQKQNELFGEWLEEEEAVNTEINRLSKEIEGTEIGKESAEAVPVLWRGIADRISLNSEKSSAEILSELSVKREPLEKIKGLIERGKAFFQAEEVGPPKGALTIFEDNRKLISLFEEANLSTLLHETAHFGLNEYLSLERSGTATEALKSDIAIIRGWVGAKEGVGFTREQSEQFAKGFELWLLEGNAPSAELSSAFARFQRWLAQVYKTVKKAGERFNIKLNKDIRGVFDRMVTANLEVEEMMNRGDFIIRTKEEMDAYGVIKEDQILMNKLREESTDKVVEKFIKARNKSLRENRKKWRQEAPTEVRLSNPMYGVIQDILKGTVDFDELEIIRSDIEQGEAARRIPVRDKDGQIIDWMVMGGTFPEYFKGLDLRKDETLNIIDKAIAGKKLTERQQTTLDTLIEGFRDETLSRIPLGELAPTFDEDMRFSQAEFIEIYGEDSVEKLPNTAIIMKDGVPIDETAVAYGFDDADSFIKGLFNTLPFSEAVRQKIAEKQRLHDEQFKIEDYLADLKPYRDYLDIVKKYLVNKLKDTDLTAREKKLASRATLKRAAKQTINTMSVREARRVDKFLNAMKKAAADERRAVLRKDWGAAAQANEKVRFNYELSSASVKIRNEVDKIIKRSKKTAQSKTIDFNHIEAIKHLVTQYNLASIFPSEPDVRPNFEKLFSGEDNRADDKAPPASNDGFAIPDFMRSGKTLDYKDLSIEQLRDLNNAIQYLAGQGRIDKNRYLSDGVTELENDVVIPANESMNKVKILKKWEKGSMMRRLSDVTRKAFARLGSLNFLARALDGYKNLGKDGVKGIVEKNVIDPIKRALNKRIVRQKEIKNMLDPHLKQIRKTLRSWGIHRTGHIKIDGAPLPSILRNDGQTKGWFGRQLFSVALNTGNESNLARLKTGYPDLTDDHIEAIKNFLSKEDWVAIQGIWDTIDTLYNDTNSVHKRIKNYGLTKIDATPVRTRHGVFKGGYYPAVYDRNLDFGIDDRKAVEDLFAREDAYFVTPFTKAGHTQKRVNGVSLPVFLDLSVINSHIDDALQYIYFAEVIKDADRITRHEGFRDSAIRIIGKPAYKSIRPALKHIASSRRTGMDLPGARVVEKTKGLATAYILAWNTGVALKQPLSTFGAMRDMGIMNYIKGFSSVLMSPSVHYQKMLELSPYMANRLTNFDREIKGEFNKLSGAQRAIYFGDKEVTWQDVVNFGYWQIRLADTVTVLPIWHGAFESKLNADQSNLQEAIEYADDIVRNSQPSAQSLDLSSWQRDGGAIRLFSLFQTFTVGKYGQRQRLFYGAWRNKSINTLDYAWFNFMDAFVPLAAINLLQSVIWGRDLEDDETQRDVLLNIFSSWALMGVPIANSLINSIHFGAPIQSPAIKTANQIVMGVVSGAKGLGGFKNDKERERALWGIANTVSILGRVPAIKVVGKAKRGAKQKKGVPIIKYLVPAPRGKK